MSFRNDGAEHRLWLLLHHLYSAVALWEQASDEERQVVEALRVKLQFFSAKMSSSEICECLSLQREKRQPELMPV